jgi:hypothetical protein
MHRLAAAFVAAALVTATLGAAGCKKTLHWKVVEDQLVQKLDDVKTATCDEAEARPGVTFRCQLVVADGGEGTVHVAMLDGRGSWQMKDRVVPAARAATIIHDGFLEQTHQDARIDCGKGLFTSTEGHYTCKATLSDGTGGDIGFFLDDEGHMRWKTE